MNPCSGKPPTDDDFSPTQTLRLISPQYILPFVKAKKNDDRSAETIAQAATRPSMPMTRVNHLQPRHSAAPTHQN